MVYLHKNIEEFRNAVNLASERYEGAKEMLLVDMEDRAFLKELIEAMYPELPAPKKRK